MINNISLIINLIRSPLSIGDSSGRPSQELINQLLFLLTTTNSNVPIFTFLEPPDSFPAIVVQHGDSENNLLNGGDQIDVLFGHQGIDILYGDRRNDILYGGQDNDFLSGDLGSDLLYGDRGNDILTGVNFGETNPGFRQTDTLIGGLGIDNFVLSTTTNIFYQDNDTTMPGLGDYALIADFNTQEDYLWLRAGPEYLIGSSPAASPPGIAIFINDDGLPGLTTSDELIAVLQGTESENQVLSRFVLI